MIVASLTWTDIHGKYHTQIAFYKGGKTQNRQLSNNPRFWRAVFIPCFSLSIFLVGGTCVAQATPSEGESIPAPQSTTKGAPPASPAATIKVTQDGWIEYPSVLDQIGVLPKDRQSVIVKGTKTKDGCNMSDSVDAGVLSVPGAQFYMEEAAYQPNSCHSRVEIARVTTEQTAAIAQIVGKSNLSDQSSQPGPMSIMPAAAPLVQGPFSAYAEFWFQDPIKIKIASNRVDVQWSSSGTPNLTSSQTRYVNTKLCVASACIKDVTYEVSSSRVISGATFTAKVTYQNKDFGTYMGLLGPATWLACGAPLSPTATLGFSTTMTVSKTSGHSLSWSDTKSGACANLLSHNGAYN